MRRTRAIPHQASRRRHHPILARQLLHSGSCFSRSAPVLSTSHHTWCTHHESFPSKPNTSSYSSSRQLSSLPAPSSPNNNNSLPQNEEDPYAHLEPIDFTTSSQISGEESQILEVQLRPNQMLRAESGAMLYMTQGVTMETSMGLGGSKDSNQGGFSKGLTRMMTGQNLMVSDFQYTPHPTSSNSTESDDYDNAGSSAYGTVGLGTDFPAKILKFDLADYPESKLVCQKGAFLAGSHSILMEMAYTKSFTSGFFGGEGFILQSLQGSITDDGEETAFLKAYGTVVKKELQTGETLRVSSGSLVCMTSTIDYDVSTMPGFKNVMFGGVGLFVTTLTGPGTVWLQGMPVDRMVSEIARKVPSGGGIGFGIPIGMGGGGGGTEGDAGDVAGGEVGDAAADAGVPGVTDAAVEADRNATVASSGMSTSDPESSESLFGDAASSGTTPESEPTSLDSTMASNDSFTTDEFSEPNTNMPEFEEPTMVDEQFEDDGTTFSTYEDESLSSGGLDSEISTPDDEGSSVLGQLWDFFKDFTDD